MEIRRILGRRGRITIPYAIRTMLELSENDVVTFGVSDIMPNTVIISKECICDGCVGILERLDEENNMNSFEVAMNYIESLSENDQEEILVKLFDKFCSCIRNNKEN